MVEYRSVEHILLIQLPFFTAMTAFKRIARGAHLEFGIAHRASIQSAFQSFSRSLGLIAYVRQEFIFIVIDGLLKARLDLIDSEFLKLFFGEKPPSVYDHFAWTELQASPFRT